MTPEYLKEQAERCRRLAKGADPFTEKRLLDLAREYDARISETRHSKNRVLAKIAPTFHTAAGGGLFRPAPHTELFDQRSRALAQKKRPQRGGH
jgi:hypothetical protein